MKIPPFITILLLSNKETQEVVALARKFNNEVVRPYTAKLDRKVQEGFYLRDKKPLTTFSVKNGDLIKTVIPQTAAKRVSLMTGGSRVELGDHPVAESIRDLGISSRPFMSVYYPERAAILPSGTVIEKGVRPLEGHRGEDRKAVHSSEYPGSGTRSIG